MSSVSSQILAGELTPTEFKPFDERQHDETIRLWAMVEFAAFINRVG